MDPLDPATALEMMRRCYDKLVVSLSPDSEFHDKGIVFCMFKHENQEWLDQNFPFLVQFDYEVVPGFSQYGRGDVVFSDPARNRLLVLQVQYLDHNTSGRSRKTKRTKKRLKVKEQALEYAERAWKKWHPSGGVFCAAVTNEGVTVGLPFRRELCTHFFRMECKKVPVVASECEGVHQELLESEDDVFCFERVPLSAADLPDEELSDKISAMMIASEADVVDDMQALDLGASETPSIVVPPFENVVIVDEITGTARIDTLPISHKRSVHMPSLEELERLDSIHRPYMHLRGHELGDPEALSWHLTL